MCRLKTATNEDREREKWRKMNETFSIIEERETEKKQRQQFIIIVFIFWFSPVFFFLSSCLSPFSRHYTAYRLSFFYVHPQHNTLDTHTRAIHFMATFHLLIHTYTHTHTLNVSRTAITRPTAIWFPSETKE